MTHPVLPVNGPLARRRVLLLAAACAASRTWAQPARRPLRLIVPAPAGGTTDVVARALAQALLRTADTGAMVDNRPGVGGAAATDALLSAAPDGATLLLSPNSIATELPYTIKPRYDPFVDLVPLAEVASVGLVLVANAQLALGTVRELVAYAKARPSPVAFASFGPGTISHLKALQFSSLLGIDMLHVGYKGSPPALADVAGGQVPFLFDGITTSAPLVKAQRLAALAVTSPERSPLLPGVPTFAELGYGELTQTIAMTLFAGAGVPADTVAGLRRQVLGALGSPELLDTFRAAGLHAGPQQQAVDDLRRAMRRDYERTGALLRSIRYIPAS